MSRRPLDREAVLQALDAQIMGLLALKRMVEGLPDDGDALPPAERPCPDRPNGEPHEVVWTRVFGESEDVGMCRFCAAEFREGPEDPVGVSHPEAP